jgi:hypothetical protein
MLQAPLIALTLVQRSIESLEIKVTWTRIVGVEE